MSNKKTKKVFKATKAAVYSKCFYDLLALGYFGVDATHFFKSLIPRENYFIIPEEALGKKGTQISEALSELLDSFLVPLMDSDGTPIEVNGELVFDEIDKKIFLNKKNKLESLSPGIFAKIQEIVLNEPGYTRFCFPEEMILYEFMSEGWSFVGKEVKFSENGSELGTLYTFSK